MRALVYLTLGGVLLAAASTQVVAEPAKGWRPVFVPADRKDLWPDGEWTAVDADLLRPELQSALNLPNPPSGYIASASYEATLEFSRFDDSGQAGLRRVARLNGRFSWRTERPQASPRVLELGTPDIAMYNLAAGTARAVWGLDDNEQTVIVVDEGSSEIEGNWAVTGTSIDDTYGFQFALPPALSTSLRISIPQRFRVISKRAIVDEEQSDFDSQSRTWTIRPARGSTTRFQVVPRRRPREQVSRLFERAIDIQVTDSTIELRADLALHFLGNRPATTTIRLPVKARLDSVFVNGSSVTTPPPIVVDGESLLQLVLPESGDVQIRLAAQLPRSDRKFTAPTVDVIGASILDGQLTALIVPPLHVEAVSTSGYQQVVGALDDGSGDQLEFVQTATEGSVVIRVAPPQPELTASELTLVDESNGVARRQTYVDLKATAGTAFDVEIDWPSEWSITDITHADNSPVESWSASSIKPDEQLLSISLRRPVAPSRSERIIIFARLDAAAGSVFASTRAIRVRSAKMKPRVIGLPASVEEIESNAPPSALNRADGNRKLTDATLLASREEIRAATSLADVAEPALERMQFFTIQDEAEPKQSASAGDVRSDVSAMESTPREITPEPALDVEAIWPKGPAEFVHVAATYNLGEPDSSLSASLRLPNEAKWLLARSTDGPVTAVQRNGLWQFAPENFNQRLTVEYAMPIVSSRLRHRMTLDCPVLFLDDDPTPIDDVPTTITLVLPDDYELLDLESSIRLDSEIFQVSFWTRLFGPLARPLGQQRFRPWSSSDWMNIFWAEQPAGLGRQTNKIQKFVLPVSSAGISFTIVSPRVTIALSWLVWWLGLGVMCVVRGYRLRNWRLTIICLLGVAGGISLLVPDELAMLSGGLICGMGFGTLIPRYYLRIPAQHVNPDADTSVALPTSLLLGSISVLLLSTRLLAAGPEFQSTLYDILVPSQADQPVQPDIAGMVYVQPSQAERLRARAASKGCLIQKSELVASFDSTQLRVDATLNVVRYNSSSGVRVPMSGRITLDSETVSVNGVHISPIPLTNAVFIPINAEAGEDFSIRFSYEIPGKLVGNGASLAGLGAVKGTNTVLRTAPRVNPNGAKIRIDGETNAYRLLRSDSITLNAQTKLPAIDDGNAGPAETGRQPTPTTLTGMGEIKRVQNPLTDDFEASIRIAGSEPVESIVLELPTSWLLTEPMQVAAVDRDTGTKKDAPTYWSNVTTQRGASTTQIKFASQVNAADLTFDCRGWIMRGQLAEPEERLKDLKLFVDGKQLECSWSSDGTVPVPLASSEEIDLGTLGQETSIKQPTMLNASNNVAQLVSVEQSGTLSDDEIRWQSRTTIDLGKNAIFGLRVEIPRTAEIVRVEASSEGRPRPPRVSVANGVVNLLFNGAISDDLLLDLEFTVTRPRQGRRPLPALRFPDFADWPSESSMTFVNDSSSVAMLFATGEDPVAVWESARTFPDWPQVGPRLIGLRDQQAVANIDYVVTIGPSGPPQLQVSLASSNGATRRTIAIPNVNTLMESADAAAPRFVTLSTSPDEMRETVSVSNFVSSEGARTPLGSIMFEPSERPDRSAIWVIVQAGYSRIPRASTPVKMNALPPWLRKLLPTKFEGAVYRVDGLSLQMADEPTEIGQATVAEARHHFWPSTKLEPTYGTSTWKFSDSGVAQVTVPDGLRVDRLLVDGREVNTSGITKPIPVEASCAALWSIAKPEKNLTIPSIANQKPKRETFSVFSSKTHIRGVGLQETTSPVIERAPLTEQNSVPQPESAEANFGNRLRVDPFARWATSVERLAAQVPLQRVTRSDPETIGKPVSIEHSHRFDWLPSTAIALGVLLLIASSFRLNAIRVWKRVADSVAESPRAVVALFGFGWWLFLTPSSLGFGIVLVVICLALFRPIQTIRRSSSAKPTV